VKGIFTYRRLSLALLMHYRADAQFDPDERKTNALLDRMDVAWREMDAESKAWVRAWDNAPFRRFVLPRARSSGAHATAPPATGDRSAGHTPMRPGGA
jgi:hypothetical protein